MYHAIVKLQKLKWTCFMNTAEMSADTVFQHNVVQLEKWMSSNAKCYEPGPGLFSSTLSRVDITGDFNKQISLKRGPQRSTILLSYLLIGCKLNRILWKW